MKEIIQLLCQEITDEIFHARAAFRNCLRAQFRFGLAFKDRFLYPYRNSSAYASPYVGGIVIFFIKVAYRFYIAFPESSEMGSALGSELAVHKAVIFLAIAVLVCQSDLDILSFQVNDGIAYLIFICFTLQ